MKANSFAEFKLNYSSPAKFNYKVSFTGNPLNRISDFRDNEQFLNNLINSESSHFTIFNNKRALFSSETRSVAWFPRSELTKLIPSDWEYTLKNTIPLELSGLTLTLLGIPNNNNELDNGKGVESYWAINLQDSWLSESKGEEFQSEIKENNLKWLSLRPTAFSLQFMEASIVGLAFSMIDWSNKNKFCSCCGSRTVSGESGYKRVCSSTLDPSLIPENSNLHINTTGECQSKSSVTNFSYPRTDPVAIFCIVSENGEEILLGKKGAYLGGMYSCLAGFIEPGESLEEAVQREAFEESGIKVKDVFYSTSQPWPFPNNLMLGCYATAINKNIKIDEKELSDANWFTKAQIQECLKTNSENWKNIGKLMKTADGSSQMPEFDLLIPDKYAIAHNLISNWANSKNLSDLLNPLNSTGNSSNIEKSQL
ncbi:hypothetical protein CONCODRAFT_4466 [Conidiobolus coronatus NRRL 28638]|uniref:NAD(+) diphosphatase n=1 Tax=Conidiobolus coronatus (strain ATCC 28846 / CBS 209.66 / NRRL 28638) TaxID=796925 RepID=A0A137PCQ8_CONC2|nr:hypothetical protein CONCODRAFT_4466 [Conidiobolus coronatus NRRL 28638]|eukprot:KXN72731.1 hypothetical protein CONCODRAFT_4466 [Conidiobolus coronatus NRRL 28638]